MSANKAKGSRFERDVRDYFRGHGIPAYRPAPEGFRDSGDIHGVPYFTVQCKDWKNTMDAIREGLDDVQVQKGHAGDDFAVNIVKRARANVSRAYAVMTLEELTKVIKRLADLEDRLATLDH